MEFCFTEWRDCFFPETDTICKPCAVDRGAADGGSHRRRLLLKNVTGSVCLQSICGQILIDEEQHFEFQAETLINK